MERQPNFETNRDYNQQRRTASGLFAASLMAESMIKMAANTEPNVRIRQRRRQQLHMMWVGFRTQLIGRATTRGVFGR